VRLFSDGVTLHNRSGYTGAVIGTVILGAVFGTVIFIHRAKYKQR